MHDKVQHLLANISADTLETVVRGAVDDPLAVPVEKPVFTEITTSHNDARTIGIVKTSGRASVSDRQVPWSSVLKIVDPNAEYDRQNSSASSLEIERNIYELGLFNDSEVPFRAARCYVSETHEGDIRTLWLEDLSDQPQPPWDLKHFVETAGNLGQFNAHFGEYRSQLPFDIGEAEYIRRWASQPFEHQAAELGESQHSELVRAAYPETPIESAMELATLSRRLFDTAPTVPHSLAFGDCHSRNLFPTKSGTVGIDWTGVSFSPTGSDIGVLIGSAMSFTVQEAVMVANSENDIYEAYISGLRAEGWNGDLKGIRTGFFAQFLGYLLALSLVPVTLESRRPRKEFLERRFGVPFDEIPAYLAPIISLIPKYVDELNTLLD